MGLKYIEHAKSIFLALLIVLSVTLTFTIWTYTPTYDTIESTPVVDILIAESKRIDDVIKPYKMIASRENNMTGSMETFDLERVVNVMKDWQISDLTLEDTELTNEELNELVGANNRYTLFFPDDVPFPVYDNILPFSISDIPEDGFDRLIVDWNRSDNEQLKVYFASSKTKTLYSAVAKNVDWKLFDQKVVSSTLGFSKFTDIQRKGNLSLYVSAQDVESIRYTYYLKEIEPKRFQDALFSDPSLVRQSPVGTTNEEYSDGTSLMNVNLLERTLSFVNPSAETLVPAIPSKLVFDSLNYINEHGGWTDEFRFAKMNPANQQIDYQLYLLGYPVFSTETSTKITAFWGDPGIFNYLRPYYTLDLSLPFDTVISTLPSGEKASRVMQLVKDIDFNNVDELTPGYYLTRDDEKRLLILEPSWFYLSNNQWTRLSPEDLGGGKRGLE
ncbi:YycH family regulatory protein [Paenisporosarcina sp. OV554]|uniref:YycH family regulatory protein n=1 Tax=Paenisporosarcina sp. OV554 TaxID=2135694 RepID=UPI000D378DF2|nr:two-component system activity regulator YycH [Paenisporosarcina sp. OV554]PUB10976.1 regulatory protein YycH of two-component signal transduction system YycFG [Paenisporosarcina sp. OV554]